MISEIASPPLSPSVRIETLVSVTGGRGEFVKSLVAQFVSKGSLSEKQWVWVDKLTADASPAKASPAALPSDHTVPGPWAAFHGAAHLANRYPMILLSAGHVWVRLKKQDGSKGPYLVIAYSDVASPKWSDWQYVGIVRPDDSITRKGAPYGFGSILSSFTAFAANPLEAIAFFGKLTGICGCCGRMLTDPVSVNRGVGPTCWSRMGGLK